MPTATAALIARLPRPRMGLLASLLLHGAALALLLVGRLTPPIEAPAIVSVDVDLISAAQFTARLALPAAPPTLAVSDVINAPDAAVADSTTAAAERPSGPFRASEFYAGSLLAEPRSAQLREAMGTLDLSERAVQLCDIEAMQQIHHARPDYDPDMVVAYAMADTQVRNGALVAVGGAFRSRREWYEISFTCSPAADLDHVAAFEFTLGDAIPHELWEAHYLTAEESDE